MSGYFVDPGGMESLGRNLERAVENIDSATKRLQDVGPESIGPDDLDQACSDFREDWGDGLKMLRDGSTALRPASTRQCTAMSRWTARSRKHWTAVGSTSREGRGMSDAKFPSLGFDPARGNVGTVRDLAKQMLDTAHYASSATDVLKATQAQRGVWQGEAADAWNGKLGELPQHLDAAHNSLEGAGKALQDWGDRLDAHQRRAHELEEECRRAIQQAQQADAAAAQAAKANAPIPYDANDPAAAQAADLRAQANEDAADRASEAASEAWERVEDIRRQAEDLRDRWEDDAKACGDKLGEAADKAPSKGLLDSMGDWFSDHSKDIGDWAGVVSAVAGTIALIPGAGFIAAPIALAAGGIAVAAHTTDMAKHGKATSPAAWVTLGADTVGMLPGVGAAARGLSTASHAATSVEGLGTVTSLGRSAAAAKLSKDMSEPAKIWEKASGPFARKMGGSGEEIEKHTQQIAKRTQATVNLGLQGPTVADKFGAGLPEDASTPVGYAGSGYTGAKTVGAWKPAGSAMGDAGKSLADFARAVR